MSIAICFKKKPKINADTAIVAVYKDNRLSFSAEELDRKNDGFIEHHLKKQTKFKGKKGQILSLSAPKESHYTHIVLLGYGDGEKLEQDSCETMGGKLYLNLSATGSVRAHFFIHDDPAHKKITVESIAAHIAMGLKLRSYKFKKYKSQSDAKDKESAALKEFEIIGTETTKAAHIYEDMDSASAGIFLARDLVNEPPNALYPESFAKRIKSELAPLGVEIDVLDAKKLHKLGFHALLAVGMGSVREPHAVIIRWNGNAKKDKKEKAPLAFVGKGVTFDTGGVNLKTSAGMGDMKCDMGGAAAVIGLMKTLALRQSKANVIGIVGLAENMPSHTAYRPSDVIESLSGKTIEVMNTDAEGRLVLADCMTYVQRTYKPRLMIDLATLTGAMMVALGSEYCGTFVNDNELWGQLKNASSESGEKLWRMPLDEAFKKDMESKISDLKTLGGMGGTAGACTAAGFLEHFVEDERPWAHMDIAGTAWIKADRPTCPKPSTGFGVRVLDRLIAENYE